MNTKVLIIEDNPFLSKLFRISFSKQDCETQEAFDGEEGWEKFLDFNPDIVVLDIVMPKLDGMSLLKKILEEKKDTFLAIITNLDKEMIKQDTAILKNIPYFKKSETFPKEIAKQVLDLHKQKNKPR